MIQKESCGIAGHEIHNTLLSCNNLLTLTIRKIKSANNLTFLAIY
jgi:hypothetical protein